MLTLKQHQYAQLAIAAAIATIFLKSIAYIVTSSVGLLSDAMESLVNLATAILTLWLIKVSLEPEDKNHQFGHTKAEYFSSMAEGLFIMLAAGGIMFTAAARIFHPESLTEVSIGVVISTIASAINGIVAYMMFKGSKAYNSPALAGEGHHLMTDVYTSAGVIIGVILVGITQINILDPLIAIGVALHILHTAWNLISSSIHGLMDSALSPEEADSIYKDIELTLKELCININFDLKTRKSGSSAFLYLTFYLSPSLSLGAAHGISDKIEKGILEKYPNCKIITQTRPFKEN